MLQKNFDFGKFADADFGALQVGHDGHFASRTFGYFAHHGGAVDMVLRGAVAEVQSHHIHAFAY